MIERDQYMHIQYTYFSRPLPDRWPAYPMVWFYREDMALVTHLSMLDGDDE